MGQHRDEKVNSFAARLNGKADLCDLVVECPEPECGSKVSFKEKIVMYQLIRGLGDPDVQAKVLQTEAQVEGGELSLNRVMKLAEALEMGKTNQELVSGAGNLNRLSDFQKNKQSNRQERRPTPKTPQGQQQQPKPKPKDGQCSFCGSKSHTSRLSDRRDNCNAFAEACTGCGTVGHYKAMCRGGPRDKSREKRTGTRPKVANVTAEKPPEPEAELGTMTGSWLLIINGHQGSVSCLQPHPAKVPHQVYNNGKWTRSQLEDH